MRGWIRSCFVRLRLLIVVAVVAVVAVLVMMFAMLTDVLCFRLAIIQRLPTFFSCGELRLAFAGACAGADDFVAFAQHDVRGEHLRIFRPETDIW